MPRSYIQAAVAEAVREQARNRCGYCLSPQHLVMARLEIEHIYPLAQGGSSTEENLWLACPLCNRYKGDKVSGIDSETGVELPLFNPRTQNWFAHFKWTEDGLSIVGITPTGRSIVSALRLNDDPDAVLIRSYWVQAGWYPPTE